MDIRLIPRDEIETPKWNGCVHYAPNSRIYGYSWYLDNVCDEWVGLVEGDYESVFPLPYNTKLLGVKQLFQPPLCQQLGLFSINVCSQARIQAFLDAIPKEFRYLDIQLNAHNHLHGALQNGFQWEERPNYILALDRPYEHLAKAYSSNLRRNLRKAEGENFYLSTDLKPEAFVEEVRRYHESQRNGIPEASYHAALRIIYNCLHRGIGSILCAYSQPERKLCAAAFVMYNGVRITNLMNVSTEIGFSKNAMHYLFDAIIRQNSNQRKILDFEGSAIEGIARFYQSFGAVKEPYFRLHANRLPFWLRWMKP